MKFPDLSLDWSKLITNTFPGLLVALTIYMLVDVFSGKDLTAKAVSGDPGVLSASIAALAGFSTFLGVFVDAIGHILFELNVRTRLCSFACLRDLREHKLVARGRPESSFTAFYRIAVDNAVRQAEIDSHYRFTEFSVNGTMALIPFAIAFPAYALRVLGMGLPGAFALLLAMAAIAGVMAAVAVENLFGWEQVKDGLVFGTIDNS